MSTPELNSRPLRHLELLIALVSLSVLQSFLSADQLLQRALLNGMFFIVVLSAMRTLSRSRIRLWATVILGCVAYALSWVGEIESTRGLVATTHVCFVAISWLLISALAEDVFSAGPVDVNRIVGAVSIYFLLGFAWAFIYALIELGIPESFEFKTFDSFDGSHTGFVSEFFYFSNVTLTTLGYGDVVPLSPPARMFATLQAMVGQLYVAIVIARLVGLHISQQQSGSDPG